MSTLNLQNHSGDRYDKVLYTEIAAGKEIFYLSTDRNGPRIQTVLANAAELRAKMGDRGFRFVPMACTIESLG